MRTRVPIASVRAAMAAAASPTPRRPVTPIDRVRGSLVPPTTEQAPRRTPAPISLIAPQVGMASTEAPPPPPED